MNITLARIRDTLGPLVIGDAGDLSVVVLGIKSLDDPTFGFLLFVDNEQALAKVLALKPTALLVSKKLAAQVTQTSCPVLISSNVMLCVARIQKTHFVEVAYPETQIHPTAVVAQSAELASEVVVGPYAVIEDEVSIGHGARIGAHCVIERGARIGARTILNPLVFIGRACRVGADCEIKPNTVIGGEGYGFAHDDQGHHHRIPQMGIVVIEDRVEIGSLCAIDRATFKETRIGEGTKLDNQVHVAHNCTVGKNCLITAGLIIAGSSTIGNNVVMGGRVSVTDHVNIGDDIQLAGVTVITNDLKGPGAYGGYPVQPLRDFLRTTASFAHVTKMRKQSRRILQHLGLSMD